jgi:hypothetical protein
MLDADSTERSPWALGRFVMFGEAGWFVMRVSEKHPGRESLAGDPWRSGSLVERLR